MRPRVLIVEPNSVQLETLRRAIEADARVTTCSTFQRARGILLDEPPDLLVTNIRLNAYNGLHLVLLSKPETHAIVYMDPPDLVVLRDAQDAHAFVESVAQLPVTLRSYLEADLPGHDRRSVTMNDRRSTSRGGRRARDRAAVLTVLH